MQPINSSKAPEALGPYSHGMKVGQMFYSSGQIPLNLEGEIVSQDVQEQTKQVMTNVGHVLEAAGLGYGDVVKTMIFISDMNDFPLINEVYGSYFTGKLPARSCVEVSRLPKDVKVEIEVIASEANE
ncbi:RidA family protein [Salinicoccus roseus]|jgi:2-iminobutanoate/2-iminopropanoate deaminase|uniref:Reactive intermediate/imine deaminase n=1 Tax=Salinicoccus roseus TaxID=45670 RepID=A0A265E6V0_9STAP|nr:RidA family protein [Salinicoccus roseus]MBY8910693.1 RidA family protein [Salinicoccus roseus]OZT77327.1 reactive intermediate/imine deaminase [Salinicoccus roseus]RPE53050.1 endoribonuclease L-PSP [Salinicoccus roseus]GGA71257.1 reactive intermediate/imine deaminase [Salinicoccus roseus]